MGIFPAKCSFKQLSAPLVVTFFGVVPVEKDGSAHFRVPTLRELYFQVLDGNGHAVQSMFLPPIRGWNPIEHYVML